ncbi:hypothetical protein CQW23_32133 [Capsicum baccatum]|uniref:PIPK domain-containing protein n=1 Tax=Capsicum baccatum TaxID=33114 RepID=A0A2G2V5S3_CAPBA|nr:hypothetical protein CQW23_32133 [Capsicum baccatum]
MPIEGDKILGDDRAIFVASLVQQLPLNLGEIIADEIKIRMSRVDTAYHFFCLIIELCRAAEVPKIVGVDEDIPTQKTLQYFWPKATLNLSHTLQVWPIPLKTTLLKHGLARIKASGEIDVDTSSKLFYDSIPHILCVRLNPTYAVNIIGVGRAFLDKYGLSRVKPTCSGRFYWADNRHLVNKYARNQAALGAKFNHVDWVELQNLLVLLGAKLASLASLQSELQLFQEEKMNAKLEAASISKQLEEVLLGMLPAYYNHVRAFENTLVTKFFGLHYVNMTGLTQNKVLPMVVSLRKLNPKLTPLLPSRIWISTLYSDCRKFSSKSFAANANWSSDVSIPRISRDDIDLLFDPSGWDFIRLGINMEFDEIQPGIRLDREAEVAVEPPVTDVGAAPQVDVQDSLAQANSVPETEANPSVPPIAKGLAVIELEEEISILDLIADFLKKKKKKLEKKGKNKREELNSKEERKAKKKAKKKEEKKELKKARLESVADNKKWEATIPARAAGASSSLAPATTKLDAPDGEKTTDDTVAGSKTQDPRA